MSGRSGTGTSPSAQPSPPVSLRAPRSKQYVSPLGSASAGVGSPSSRHRPMKCSCEAERSFNSAARHLAMNSYGVMGAFSVADDDRHRYDGRAARPRAVTGGIVGPDSVSVCSPASRVLASLPPRSAGLTPLTPAPRTLVPDWPLDDDALSHAPSRRLPGGFGAKERPSRMPVRSCLRLYRPERPIAVKHYWSMVYMYSMLHSGQYGAEQNNVDLRTRIAATLGTRTTSIHQTRTTAANETRTLGAHEIRTSAPTGQISTTPSVRSEQPGQMDSGGVSSRKQSRT